MDKVLVYGPGIGYGRKEMDHYGVQGYDLVQQRVIGMFESAD
jgi:hypothetical protein